MDLIGLKIQKILMIEPGDMTTSGRIYIALPENTIITVEIKKKYNII